MVDRAERSRGNAEFEGARQRIAFKRHIAKVRQKPTLRFVIRMRHIIAYYGALAGELAYTRHGDLFIEDAGGRCGHKSENAACTQLVSQRQALRRIRFFAKV